MFLYYYFSIVIERISYLAADLQYSPQIVETETVFLEFSRKFLTFTLHTFVLTHSNVHLSFPNVELRVFWCTETTILLLESGILGFGIGNTAQEIRNLSNDWNPESEFYWQILDSSTWNPESTAWNPESKTVLDSLKNGAKRQQLHCLFFLLANKVCRAENFINIAIIVRKR